MRRFVPSFVALALASGCGAGLVGEKFEGECLLFDRGEDPVSIPVELEFVRDRGGELLGEGRYGWDGNEFLGEVEGEYIGDDAVLELAGVSGGYTVTLFIDAEFDGEDELEGSCSFFESEGDFSASR